MTTGYKDKPVEQLPISTTQVYLTPTVKSAHIISATATNITTSTATIYVTVTKSGGSAALYIERQVAAKQDLVLNGIINRVLTTGDTVDAYADTASAINLDMGVKEITT
jgi:hypothetical protein